MGQAPRKYPCVKFLLVPQASPCHLSQSFSPSSVSPGPCPGGSRAGESEEVAEAVLGLAQETWEMVRSLSVLLVFLT